MSSLLQDVRYGLRMLLKTPVVTLVAGISLAAGIAVNASSFALVEAFLFAPLPYEDQDRLAFVWYENLRRDIDQAGVPGGTFLDMRRETSSFASLAAYTTEAGNVTGGERPEQVTIMTVTPDYFRTLGVRPAMGRDFLPEEGVEGAGPVVVLHHEFWTSRFAADPDAIGSTLVIDGTPHTVIGSMPEGFDPLPADADVFRPSDFASLAEERSGDGLILMGRLSPGTDAAAADREMDRIQGALAAAHPEALQGWSVRVEPVREVVPGPTDRRLVLILTAVTLFGLVIACANVANLLLARAEGRQKEVAVRTAMGAERGRILRQLITESVVLAGVSGVVGTIGARWILVGFRTVFPPDMPDALLPVLSPGTLSAVLFVTLGSGILFGLAPALSLVRSDLRSVLGEGSRGGTAGRGRKRLRNAFVVGEFAVALGLLTGAVFMGRAFQGIVDLDTGFRADEVIAFSVALPHDRYPDDASIVRFQEGALEALRAIPGVREAAVMTSVPRTRNIGFAPYEVEGREPLAPADRPTAVRDVVSPGWFAALDVAVEEGRAPTAADGVDAPPVVVVNRAFVEREFPSGDAVGQRVVVMERSREIVGVAEDVLHERIPDPGEGGRPAVYLPAAQVPTRAMWFAVLGTGDPAALAGPVRGAVEAVDPDQPIGSVQTVEAAIAASLAGPRVMTLFLLVIAGVALALAAMGIYGVQAHTVALQRRELGIRMALGADSGSVLALVGRSGLRLVGFGLLIGAPLAALMYVATARTLTGLSDRLNPVAVFAAIGGALAVVAIVACLVPAVRATRVDPVSALSD